MSSYLVCKRTTKQHAQNRHIGHDFHWFPISQWRTRVTCLSDKINAQHKSARMDSVGCTINKYKQGNVARKDAGSFQQSFFGCASRHVAHLPKGLCHCSIYLCASKLYPTQRRPRRQQPISNPSNVIVHTNVIITPTHPGTQCK